MTNKQGENKGFWFYFYNIVFKYGIWVFAAVVVLLNLSLIFDYVVWGDEAFSINTVRDVGFDGIYQRVLYWDNHPILYYIWIKIWSWLLCSRSFEWYTENRVWVYHLASVVPFIGGVTMLLCGFRKKLGNLPAFFFVTFTGLSAVCAEYNQEIRMYSLVFFFILWAALESYRIITSEDVRISAWTGMTIAAVLAAYTHYYGAVTGGLLIFVTSLFYYIKHKKLTFLYGVGSVIGYFILYWPWLNVLRHQSGGVVTTWWMEAPDPFNEALKFIFGGKHMFPVLGLFAVAASLFLLLFKMEKGKLVIRFKAKDKKLGGDITSLIVCWITLALVFCFAYGVSYLVRPLFTCRYSYPAVPLVVMIVMLCVKGLISMAAKAVEEETLNELNEGLDEHDKAKKLSAYGNEINVVKTTFGKVMLGIVLAIGVIILCISLFDFRYYRSVCKTENLFTRQTLETIGIPNEGAIMCATDVQHLAWTVLSFYYPDNEVKDDTAVNIAREADELAQFSNGEVIRANEIWYFTGREVEEAESKYMESLGYTEEAYPGMWVGKYGCNIYHYWR